MQRTIAHLLRYFLQVLRDQGLGKYCDPAFVRATSREMQEAMEMTEREFDEAAHRLLQAEQKGQIKLDQQQQQQQQQQQPRGKQRVARFEADYEDEEEDYGDETAPLRRGERPEPARPTRARRGQQQQQPPQQQQQQQLPRPERSPNRRM